MSFLTVGSSNLRPINLLTSKIVLSGLVTACLFADCPTSCSLSVHATMLGVVLAPSLFSITFGTPFSIMARHELVVPKSMARIASFIFMNLLVN